VTSEDRPLEGKVALVTGAARNIGRAIAVELGKAGANLMVTAHRDRDGIEETVSLVRAAGSSAEGALGDIRSADAVAGVVAQTVERFMGLDILVNNAAIRRDERFEDITLSSWRDVFSVIVDGAFLYSHAALPHLLKSDAGRILNIGGRTGHSGAPNRAHVVAAKSAMIGFTKALALEFAGRALTVNLVSPGQIDSFRGASAAKPIAGVEHANTALVGRKGSVDEVAAFVTMLAGPKGGFLTGQTIHVNGGDYMP
jgi:3-oxoacyl-[acyl-carrier protein] reductase